MTSGVIEVVAGIAFRGESLLLCQRHEGPHLALLWEFPGGKIEPGETPREALARELLEELGTGAEVGSRFASLRHEYPEKTVRLQFFRVQLAREPRALVHRALAWVPARELHRYPAPPPNAEIIARIQRGELLA